MTETTAAPSHRSFSQLNTLRRCGEAYRLSRVEGIPSRPSVPAVAGAAVHLGTETTDRRLEEWTEPSEAQVQEIIEEGIDVALSSVDDEVRSEEWPVEDWNYFGKQNLDWFRSDGIPNSIRAYVGWRVNSDLELAQLQDVGLGIEIPFVVKLWEIELRGYIDRLLVQPETMAFYVLDLKTGHKPATDEQLGLYRYALSEQYGIDVTWGGFLYNLKGGPGDGRGQVKLTQPIDLRHWSKEKLYLMYSKADFLIKQGIYLPFPGDNCFTCDVKHACQFAQAAI